VIDLVVAPFDHRYEFPVLEVRTTLPPAQNVVGPFAVIVALGNELTVTVLGAEVPLHVPLVTVTENVPELLTVIDFVVAPFDHR